MKTVIQRINEHATRLETEHEQWIPTALIAIVTGVMTYLLILCLSASIYHHQSWSVILLQGASILIFFRWFVYCSAAMIVAVSRTFR